MLQSELATMKMVMNTDVIHAVRGTRELLPEVGRRPSTFECTKHFRDCAKDISSVSRVQSETGRSGHGHIGKTSMTSASISIAPANSLIGISDVKKGVAPTSMPESGIASTESCILVACYPEIDGETKIT